MVTQKAWNQSTHSSDTWMQNLPTYQILRNSDRTHPSLLQCENRTWKRPEQAHILCQWEGFLLRGCITSSHALLSPGKKALTILKYCTASIQGAPADLIWVHRCRLPCDTMPEKDGCDGDKSSRRWNSDLETPSVHLFVSFHIFCFMFCF